MTNTQINAAPAANTDPKVDATRSVADFFAQVLACEINDESLAECPLASVCGDDCRRAIEAARQLLDCVEQATGDDYPDRNRAVRDVALHCCLTFING